MRIRKKEIILIGGLLILMILSIFILKYTGYSIQSIFSRVTIDEGFIVYANEFNGSTTDFLRMSDTELENIENMTLEVSIYGKIIFSENINLTQDAVGNIIDLDSNVEISQNFIEINTTALTSLEKPATLYLYNLNFSDPRILRNGEVCSSSICVKISYSGGILIFTVTQFQNANYSAEETPPVPGEEAPGAPGAPEVIPPSYLEITPREFNIRMAINTNQPEKIKITNTGTTKKTISISQSNLDTLVILGAISLELSPGETKYLNVIFVAPNEPGIYTGKILIDKEEVLVTLNVKTKLLLFDSNIVVLNKNYKVARGDKLRTQVTLIPLGDEERLDVTLNYVIKDYEGKIYLRQTETVLVEKKVDFKKNFATGSLPLGEYIVGLELVYPGGVAPSSAYFEVVETLPEEFFVKLVLFLIISILIIAVIIIALLIRKRIEESRR